MTCAFIVDPTTHKSNHAHQVKLAAEGLEVPWTNGRQGSETREEHAQRTRRLHDADPGYHRAALRGLEVGRVRRGWTDEAMIEAVQAFHVRAGQWPHQIDFRSANGLPGVGTVARRYGSHRGLVRAAKETSLWRSSR